MMIVRLCCLVLMLGLSACAHALKYEMTQQELQDKVEKSFPLRKETSLAVMVFSSPKVILKPESNRLGLAMSLQAEVQGQVIAKGTGMVDGEVEYVPASGEFRLRNPKVSDLLVDGMTPAMSAILQGMMSDALIRAMPVIVVYKLDEKEFRQSMAKQFLKGVRVDKGKIVAEMDM